MEKRKVPFIFKKSINSRIKGFFLVLFSMLPIVSLSESGLMPKFILFAKDMFPNMYFTHFSTIGAE